VGNAHQMREIAADQADGPCPFLGLLDDDQTRALYARDDHRCLLQTKEKKPLDISWQRRYCLTSAHTTCPLFQAHAQPEMGAARVTGRLTASRLLLAGVAVAAALAVGLVVSALNGHIGPTSVGSAATKAPTGAAAIVGTPTAKPSPSPTAQLLAKATSTAVPTPTPTPIAAPTPTPSPAASPSPTPSATPPPTSTATATATVTPTPTPAPPAPTPTSTPTRPRTYVIQPGDTLIGIASKFNISVQQLADLNHISDPNLIYAGAVLQLPPP
jgi:LysM repeat protein